MVKYHRLNKGYSLRDLAVEVNISHTLISNIEKGLIAANVNTLEDIFSILEIEFFTSEKLNARFIELYNQIMNHIINYEYQEAHRLLLELEQHKHVYENSPNVINYVIIRCLFYLISDRYIEDKDKTLRQYEIVLDHFNDQQKQLFYFAKGLDYLNLRYYKDAFEQFTIAKSLGDKSIDFLIDQYVVTSLMRMHKFMDGIRLAQESIRTCESKTLYVRAMYLRLQISYASGIIRKFDYAEELIAFAEQYANKTNNTILLEECLMHRASIALKKGKVHTARDFVNKVKYSKEYSYYYIQMQIAAKKHDRKTYQKYLLEAMKIPLLKYSSRAILIFEAIGLSFEKNRDDQEYEEHLEKLVEYGKISNDQELLDAVLNMLISFYQQHRMYKKAMETAKLLLHYKKFGT